MSGLRNRIIFVGLLTLLAVYLISPSIVYFSMPKNERNDSEKFDAANPHWLPEKHIKLGLDLQGGVQLVLGVDTAVAIDNKLGRMGTEMARWANTGDKKQVKQAYNVDGTQTLKVELEPGVDIGDFVVSANKEFVGLAEESRDDKTVVFSYEDDQLRQIKRAALNQAEKVVRNRVDKWGVAEPSISRRIDGTILVQLPGFKDPAKARELLGRTAQLSFRLLNEESKAFEPLLSKLPEGITYSRNGNFGAISFAAENQQAIIDFTKGFVPEGSELLFEVQSIAGGKKSLFKSHLVFANDELSGEDILDANATYDTSALDNRPAVSLRFTGPGGKRFGEITGDNIKKRMAIVLDHIVVSDPVIQTRIATGNAQITMGSDRGFAEQQQEAQDLALILKSGALPAPITILEERQVGATLGPELANEGVFSVGMGLLFVLVFMLAYYRRPGLISCISLMLNGLFLMAGMALFGFSLTLPGFAGFILTLGMGVDANVLINERIRQELRSGRTAKKALDEGFGKVFWTIIDANVTTLIAALVLLETNSSGPIKGFSVALILGILVSMFTSLFCSRVMFMWIAYRSKSDKSVKAWLGEAAALKQKVGKFDFLKGGKLASGIGVALAVAVIAVGASKGINWSVDFAGGTELEMTFAKQVSPDEIKKTLATGDIAHATLQTVGGGGNHYLIRFDKSLAEQKAAIQDLMLTGLKSYGPEIQRVDYVGPVIGRELRQQGAMSVGWAILGVLIYIGLRFDMRFGPGAVIKMIQDIFIIMGFYIFFQRSFDLTSVAALLTAVGYSVNDTIVIYDRIRENLSLNPRENLYKNINLAINETLSRTINTSLTTIIALGGILIFASSQIWNFAAAMVVGVVSATLSSTFIASYVLLAMEKWRASRQSVAKA